MFYHKFEAIPSWYGYDYQGILSIYYAIKKINSLLNNIEQDSIDKKDVYKAIDGYSIELEYMEDFSIKFNGKYVSFHQVKSGEGSLKEVDVRDTYLKLLEENMEQNTDAIGYFHVNKGGKLENVKKVLETNMKDYFNNLKENLLALKNKKLGDEKGKKGSDIQILRAYMKENNSIGQADSVDNICTKIDMILDEYFNKDNKYKKIFVCLKEYPKAFSNIESIENQIFEELKLFHLTLSKEEFKINKQYLEKERCKIGCVINEHIDKREHDKNYSREILLKDFVDIMFSDLNEWGSSKEYYEYKFKEKLHNYYFQYKSDREDSQKCDGCNESCYLRSELEKIKGLSTDEFKKFLNNISILKRKDCFDFPSETEIKQTLFRCMCENHKIGREAKYNIGIIKDNNDYWVIATLEDEEIPFIKKLFKEENENKNILRDADILITKDISIKDIRKYNKFCNVDKDDMKEVLGTNIDGKYDEIDNYTKNRVSSIKKWTEVKGELK